MKNKNLFYLIFIILIGSFSCSEDKFKESIDETNASQKLRLKSGYEETIYEIEPNNSKSQANYTPITPGCKYIGIYQPGNPDFTRVEVEEYNLGCGIYSISFYLDSDPQVKARIYRYSDDSLIAEMNGKQAVNIHNLSLGDYYLEISGNTASNYTFYVDPNFSVVNSEYYILTPQFEADSVLFVEDYISSPFSIGNAVYYTFSDGYYGIYQYEEYLYNVWVNGYYCNNQFPIIYAKKYRYN